MFFFFYLVLSFLWKYLKEWIADYKEKEGEGQKREREKERITNDNNRPNEFIRKTETIESDQIEWEKKEEEKTFFELKCVCEILNRF